LIVALWIGASVPLAVVRVVHCLVVPQRQEQCGSLSGAYQDEVDSMCVEVNWGPLGFRSGRVHPVDIWS